MKKTELLLKVSSFNIRYGLADDGSNCWENRKEKVVERIRAFGAGLLGLQECRNDFQAEFLRNELNDYHFFGVPRGGNDSTALEMAPVLCLESQFKIKDKGCFWLSETPEIAASKSWESAFARTATWVEIFTDFPGQSMLFLNTHFDLEPTAILESAKLLRKWIEVAAMRLPVIVTGDFNSDKDSAAYQILTASGFSDAYRCINPDSYKDATFNGFGAPQQVTPIDWILVSDHFTVIEAKIDGYHEGGLYPSDHFPITASLKLKL